MYFKIFVLTVILVNSGIHKIKCTNVGSSLFYNKNIRSRCWSELEIAKLRARKVFEKLALKTPLPEDVNSKYIRNVIQYFKRALRSLETGCDKQTSEILKGSLGDMIGGHLRHEILPTARFAYYAGYVSYKDVRSLHDFYEDTKKYLNTLGLGWKAPLKVPRWSNLSVSKVFISRNAPAYPCKKLIFKRDANSCIHIPKPKLDDEREPSAINLPFKYNGFVGLRAPRSENIVLKYYITAAKCILQSSPKQCRHDDFLAFNNDLWHWMKRDIAIHLVEEDLYVAYGGILRVAAAVQNYGKGLSRRNLFDIKDKHTWAPWKRENLKITDDKYSSCVFYIILVVILASVIYLIQIIQNYIFGKASCNCFSPRKEDKEVIHAMNMDYTNIESNIPSILPSHSYIPDENIERRCSNKTSQSSIKKNSSNNSEKIVRYEDLSKHASNPGEMIEPESATTSRDKSKTLTERSSSPPKIIPEVTQLRLLKARKIIEELNIPKFSTSGSTSRSRSSWSSGSCSSDSSSSSHSNAKANSRA